MSIKKIFDAGADKYDYQRRKVIPCFNDFYQTVIDLIPFDRHDSFTFLDLGAGTGLLTAFITNLFPGAHATLVDLSESMLKKARERFSLNKNITFLIADYSEYIFREEYDLVVSAMSIHHLSESKKIHLYKRVFDVLRPGGSFINADLVKGETKNTEKKYQDIWMDWIKETDLSENELSRIIERMEYDRPSLLKEQLLWLEEAGFNDIDCYYKYYNFSVFSGRKMVS